ncbi:SusD family protein [compost metagenome]
MGLRAFLHFDLLRLFAPSVAEGGLNVPGIPYAKVYKASSSPRLQVSSVIDNILADLAQAESLMKSDPLYTSTTGNLDRNLRFNFYAVKALQARVYLWKGDKANALAAAEAVIAIADAKFPFVLQTDVVKADQTQINRVFTTEHLFGLQVNKLETNITGLLTRGNSITSLTLDAFTRREQFETSTVGATDYRNQYLVRSDGTVNPFLFFAKLFQPTGIPVQFAKRMPLIKIPEMYYIAAECLAETNGTKAVGYLNKVRSSRGIISALSTSLSSASIYDEIRKEYWKEMPSEGQFFFYLKRMNSSWIPNDYSGIVPNYVLPIPPLELEFGS